MHNEKEIVMNTGPIIALAAALNDLHLLDSLYGTVHVPYEVAVEIRAKGAATFAVEQFNAARGLMILDAPVATIPPLLRNNLDLGEASVIQYALDHKIPTVCIDEIAGRRVARLCGLKLTGSLGILLRAKREGYPIVLKTAIRRMTPDWVCEITSPGHERKDLFHNFMLLQRNKVSYYWVISPEDKALIAYELVDEKYRVTLSVEYRVEKPFDKARIPPFEEVEIDLNYIFGDG
ncbi:Uma2 family endonuclease [Candidatus Thiosymbion oneisti]|uniref:Uma2 family endonuclease n=2 Tax=Candidatus Thiosymbion oneisti TaxID=589554 RepID=UPI000A7F618F|nr:Uma2 family endonuclease [Candidatus Thiosymbion oneisti]